MVCVKPLPARMTAGLSCGIPGHGSSICPGLISGSMTKNTDSTTFPSGGGARPATHSWMMCGETMEPVNCPFCSPPADAIVAKNRFCYARWDRYPVSKGHMLVIPFRHVQDFFDLAGEEKCAILELVGDCKWVIEKKSGAAIQFHSLPTMIH